MRRGYRCGPNFDIIVGSDLLTHEIDNTLGTTSQQFGTGAMKAESIQQPESEASPIKVMKEELEKGDGKQFGQVELIHDQSRIDQLEEAVARKGEAPLELSKTHVVEGDEDLP